jgi:PIN domain nuclease of toxin-antitoxin system
LKLLLDTHALFWWVADERRLSRRANKAIAAQSNTIYVSPASAYELTFKYRLGLLPDAGALIRNFAAEMEAERFQILPISLEHGRRAGDLSPEHRDPFDRLLAAQAIAEAMRIVSNDEKLSALGAERMW